MTKQTIPSTSGKTISELSKDEIVTELAKFQEALKSDQIKDADVYKALGIEAPKVETPKDNSNKNQETIDRILPAYQKAREELVGAGFDFSSHDSKMSEAEKEINGRLEKQAKAKFAEQLTEITKIDPDFPVEAIKNMDISTDDKITVMATLKEVASRNSEAVEKIQSELTKVSDELKDVKMSAPGAETEEAPTGESLVKSALSKFGMKDESEGTTGDTE